MKDFKEAPAVNLTDGLRAGTPMTPSTHNSREENTIEWQGKEYPICRKHEVVYFTEVCPQCGKDYEQIFRNNIVSQFATFNLGEGIIEREQRIMEAVLEISTNHLHQELQKAREEERERLWERVKEIVENVTPFEYGRLKKVFNQSELDQSN